MEHLMTRQWYFLTPLIFITSFPGQKGLSDISVKFMEGRLPARS